jgi:photosystem II stability/assembly factor-like uncharacterized protein
MENFNSPRMACKQLIKVLATTWVFLLGTLNIALSQNDWREMINDRSYNFFDVQQAFENDLGGVPYQKGLGIKQYRRWEYYWENRVDVNGNFPPEGHVLNEMTAYYQSHPTPKGYVAGSGTWIPQGPYPTPNNGTGQLNGNGRVTCIAFHPTDTNVIYTAGASGGFWKSDDNGATWTEYSSGLVRLGISRIIVHPTNPNIIYIATGDRDGGDAPGYGVWRTTNGGNSWSAHNSGMGNRTINDLIMHPTNPDIMIAAGSNQRIYRTTNGGSSWTQSSSLGMNPKDLAMHPTNPNIIYASGTSMRRSTNGGVTWSTVSGLPSAQRIAMAVSPDQPNWVYLLIGNGNGLVGIYRSTNSGVSFSLRTSSPNILGYATNGSDNASQAWYDLVMIADPTDADIIYTGGINIWKSIDGGQTMSCKSYWVGQSGSIAGVHADQHVFEYSPHSGDLYNGNDGGVYKTTDGGTTWTDLSDGLGIAQVYKIGVSQQTEDLVINGYQDNGTAIFDNGTFTTEIGGDGMECIIDPTNDTYMYGALYFGNIRRSTNGGTSFSTISNGVSESGAWVTPYKLDPNNSNRMFAGYRNVWRNDNVQGGTSWTQISNLGGSSTMTDLAIAPSNSDVVYISRRNNTFLRSNNATGTNPTWTNLTSNLPINNEPKDIEIDPTDPNHVFIAINNDIFESTNGGNSWTNISGTLPNISLNTIVIDHNSPVSAMYVGMDVAVYYKDDNLSDWVIYNSGLANVEITELEIYYGDCTGGELYASTYGQGLWKSDLRDPGNQSPTACFEVSANDVCQSQAVDLIDVSSFGPTSWSWSITPGTYTFVGGTSSTSQNPQVQFTAPGVYTVQLTATNATGNDVLTKPNEINVSGAIAPCLANDDFETYSTCATSSNCGGTVCPIGGNWSNLTNGTEDDIDWRVDENGTPSNNTGPSVDYNPGTNTGNYLYLEASSCSNRTGILESTCIELHQDYNVNFAYHMYGNSLGSLHVDILTGGVWVEDVIPPVLGDQGNSWQLATVDLSAYTGQSIKLRIRGITGSSWSSDIAIDDIQFNPIPVGPVSISSCGLMTSPSGNQTWVSSGTYTDTLTSSASCDSIVIYDFQLNNPSSSSLSITNCNNYTWSTSGVTYNTSGTYQATLTNAAGCDSIVTLNLTINNSSSATETITSCDTYTWPLNGNTYSTTGNYTTIINNANGCDSVVTLDLTLGTSYANTETVIACDTYTWSTTGQDYTISGSYSETLVSQLGCDSTMNLELTIESVDATATLSGNIISANQPGADYMWIDCGDSSTIPGETGQNFTPETTGNYAVIVTENGCTDTSDCILVDYTGLIENTFENDIHIYPNPTEGMVTIELSNGYDDLNVVITDALGRIVQSFEPENKQLIFFELDEANGTYFVKLTAGNEQAIFKVLKQ